MKGFEYGFGAHLHDQTVPGFKDRHQAEQIVIDKAFATLPKGLRFCVGEIESAYGVFWPIRRRDVFFYTNDLVGADPQWQHRPDGLQWAVYLNS